MSYVVITDSNADMPVRFALDNDVLELQLVYTMDNKSYLCHDPALSRPAFYDKMRTGKMPQTSAVNMGDAVVVMEPLLKAGKDVLCVMFSSALSATHNSVCLARDELAEQYPNRKIVVIDTLAASGGQAILVERAVECRNQGLSIEEAEELIRQEAPHMAHMITVDDLFHLHRGGRVSVTAAVVGSVLGIKPVLHVDDSGKLVPIGKVRGRKQSLLALVTAMADQIDLEKCDRFAITHGDCEEDAAFVAAEIIKRFGIRRYTINYIGPTVGAHSGPGTVALCFYAKKR